MLLHQSRRDLARRGFASYVVRRMVPGRFRRRVRQNAATPNPRAGERRDGSDTRNRTLSEVTVITVW